MGKKFLPSFNVNKIDINDRAYGDNNSCAIVMGILTKSSIAVCLMIQRRNNAL